MGGENDPGRGMHISGPLLPDHLADLRRSGLTDETIRAHRLHSLPRHGILRVLGWNPAQVSSAYIIGPPGFPDGFFRLKVFPSFQDRHGRTVKYLQPRSSGMRLFIPIMTREEVLGGGAPLWLVEGEKKSLAVAQLGLPAVGFCGIEGWHVRGSTGLLLDFDLIPLRGRVVELVPDGDWGSNHNVRRGVERLARALLARGATPRLVALPERLEA